MAGRARRLGVPALAAHSLFIELRGTRAESPTGSIGGGNFLFPPRPAPARLRWAPLRCEGPARQGRGAGPGLCQPGTRGLTAPCVCIHQQGERAEPGARTGRGAIALRSGEEGRKEGILEGIQV